jgi:hypothetical protein
VARVRRSFWSAGPQWLLHTTHVAARHDLPEDWLNDGVKGFLPGDDPRARQVHESDSLRVDVASPEYLLAMKLFAAREQDVDDIVQLCAGSGLQTEVYVDGVDLFFR